MALVHETFVCVLVYAYSRKFLRACVRVYIPWKHNTWH